MAETILKKEEKGGRLAASDAKIYCIARVIRTMWCWQTRGEPRNTPAHAPPTEF